MFFSIGRETHEAYIDNVFRANRQRLVKQIRKANDGDHGFVIYMEGGESITRFDSDHEPIFRQESYYLYLTGVREPDTRLIISFEHSNDDGDDDDGFRTILLIPRLPPEYATIMGAIQTTSQWKERYHVDQVCYTDETDSVLGRELGAVAEGNGQSDVATKKKLLRLKGLNSDSGKMYNPPPLTDLLNDEDDDDKARQVRVDDDLLFPILAECRVIKSQAEQKLLQHITEVTSFAHAYVMRNMKPGMMEYQGESLFRHYCYYNYGCRLLGYTAICGCGPNSAVLHYGHAGEPNEDQSKAGDMCLFDMGAEYFGYGSDVTCSFPISGIFSLHQTPIYSGVLKAQIAVYNKMKPGVSWIDCHKTAELELLKALTEIGLVQPDGDGITDKKSLHELMEMRLGAVFMPHGLGHFIGIDTHDVGGYLAAHSARIMEPGLKSLRTARILQEGMTITVEPGCYFIDHLLNEALSDKSPLRPYLNVSQVEKYRGFGGVRLEDVVAVTSSGCINFTLCPRTIAEVEHVMRGGNWPPTTDEAPELRRERLTSSGVTPLPAPPSN